MDEPVLPHPPRVIKSLPTRATFIYPVIGGGIHPVARRIAELTGGQPFDGFRSSAPFDQIAVAVAVAVIDSGGTAQVGVYTR